MQTQQQHDNYGTFEPELHHEHGRDTSHGHPHPEDEDHPHSSGPLFLGGETGFFEAIQQGPGSGMTHLSGMDDEEHAARAEKNALDNEHALTTLFSDEGDGPASRGGQEGFRTGVDDLGNFEIMDPSEVDPALHPGMQATTQENGPGPGPGQGQHKRKATSRANMLVRGGACDFCKKRRIKCSAEEPSCAACVRAGKDCVYMQKKQKSRVKVLQDRLAELESRLGPKLEVQAQDATTTVAGLDRTKSGDGHGHGQGNAMQTPAGGKVLVDPDLMTLADAAAGNSAGVGGRWEKLSPEVIGKEIIQAVEGVKGVGEKIVSHL
jgi:hypothetical protein